VPDIKELTERISYVHSEVRAPALVEEFIEGRELYVVVLGGEKPTPLPVIEWDFSGLPKEKPKIASTEAKWAKGSPYEKAPVIIPTDLPEPLLREIEAAALTAFSAVKLRDYGRIDVRLRRRTEP
jgi:D-alanine-D-alanine ligase